MSESQHNPGPWKINERFDVMAEINGTPVAIASLVEGRFASHPYSVALSMDAVRANGGLIAAAPNLLAASKRLVDWLDKHYCITAETPMAFCELWDKLREVVEQAEESRP